ncbi:RIP metalloprotease RseP [Ligilactobacillus pobuzihii]|uniref:Zinc metalloprotease n=1 Tax=Ligilactobacillus pobuzihii TaxID=449659 RepID=A0A0R2LTM3_9LACO|nr:RIP metalloprotease RseP [Ligilactobacillus pobuzihii]KRK11338.1 metalloprotease [Ligilactobacillus pobuzihii E100301 = KCTC 13174]KRO02653.1 metalloprotease [Ligilactobacillus pobuzihii]GEN47395.1 zinc metalloprotease [Ligilactobacillus pobuzihii]
MFITIIAFIIVFGIIVTSHEFGHFIVAKKSGILVREFSIGMGPKLFATHKNGTTYTIRILPLGGYVRMAGLEDDEETLQKGMPVNLILDENQVVKKINTSSKVSLLNGLPLEVTNWDLIDELYIEGYENGDETKLRRLEVKPDAMIIETDGTEVQIAPRNVQFQSVSLTRRILTNIAGPLNNFILAILAFILIAFIQGGSITTINSVGAVQENSVAQKAGLQKNDKIVAVQGKKTNSWDSLSESISDRGGKKTELTVKRGDQKKKIILTPKKQNSNGQQVGMIGIKAGQKVDHSIGGMLSYGFTQTYSVMKAVWDALVNMFHGFSLNDLGGPVAMYSFTQQAAKYGAISVINLLAFLSINLGIVNLLPIPALDGGKLLLNIIEAIRGKPLDPNKETIITLIGFGFMMLLMILVTWNDIQRYFF